MVWKELSYWKKGIIIGIIFGAVLGLLDFFLVSVNAEGRMLSFVPGYVQLLLLIISIPGVVTFKLSESFTEKYFIVMWFAGIAGLAIFYGLIGTVIGVVVGYYKNKPKLKKHSKKNINNKRKNRV
ncbi:hypothetical protein HY636_01505 [Candidatus Woesearchaeota archaeon]|nr:hypothetical protein [Candidatus Woesearchaeota archaeon]